MANPVMPQNMLVQQHTVGSGSPMVQCADVNPTQAALTDNGGGTADGTVASMAAPTTITDSSGLDGTHNDTVAAMTPFAASVAWNGSSVYPSAADEAALTAALNVLAQNQSDLAQKIIEIVTWMTTVQNNMKEVTTRLAEVKVDIAAVISSLQGGYVMAS